MDTQKPVEVVDIESFGKYWNEELTKESRASLCNQVLNIEIALDWEWGLIAKEQQNKLYCAYRRFVATCE